MRIKQRGFVGIMSMLLVVGTAAAVSIPSYNKYAKRTRIGEGLVLASAYKNGLTDFYINHGDTWPTGTTEEIHKKIGMSPFERIANVQSMEIENKGVIKISYTPKVQRGGVLYLEPSVQKNPDKTSRIVWRCYSNNMKGHALPAECR